MVFPDGSEGSIARPPMRPVRPPLAIGAGPTAVQDCCEMLLVGSWVKMRKWGENWSATGSPKPEPGTELFRVSFQLTSVPFSVEELLWMERIQSPSDP